jgi:hypothetical protein
VLKFRTYLTRSFLHCKFFLILHSLDFRRYFLKLKQWKENARQNKRLNYCHAFFFIRTEVCIVCFILRTSLEYSQRRHATRSTAKRQHSRYSILHGLWQTKRVGLGYPASACSELSRPPSKRCGSQDTSKLSLTKQMCVFHRPFIQCNKIANFYQHILKDFYTCRIKS